VKARTPGHATLDLLTDFLVQRFAGLALVLVSMTIFLAMTVPGGSWYEHLIAGVVAVGAAFCGLPLFVTGRIRQPRVSPPASGAGVLP
jgi:hypothetical protein